MVAVGVGQLDGLTLRTGGSCLSPDEPLRLEGDGKVEGESFLLRKEGWLACTVLCFEFVVTVSFMLMIE